MFINILKYGNTHQHWKNTLTTPKLLLYKLNSPKAILYMGNLFKLSLIHDLFNNPNIWIYLNCVNSNYISFSILYCFHRLLRCLSLDPDLDTDRDIDLFFIGLRGDFERECLLWRRLYEFEPDLDLGLEVLLDFERFLLGLVEKWISWVWYWFEAFIIWIGSVSDIWI